MSMLARYQKPGGFTQLIQLIETCGKQKQDNFIQMIEKEDIHWAKAVREKMLTIEKIFSWDTAVVSEISVRLHELTLAVARHGLGPEETEKLMCTYTHSQKRNIDDLFKAKSPTPAEVSSAFFKIIQEVRNMVSRSDIKLEKIAPEMIIPKDIEDMLKKSAAREEISLVHAQPDKPGATHEAQATSAKQESLKAEVADTLAKGAADGEIFALKKRLQILTSENNQLKTEIHMLREKLNQIKKIA